MKTLTDNKTLHRFEGMEEGRLVYADYLRQNNVVVIRHVEADPALRGKGAAGRFMASLLDQVREEGLKVSPQCSWAASFIHRHPEYQDLLAS